MEKSVINKELILLSYANEGPLTENHMKIIETQLDFHSVPAGDVVVQNQWVSVDPFLRWLFRNQAKDGLYFNSLNLDEPMRCFMMGRVVMSGNAGFKVGDVVTGLYGVGEYSIVAASALRKVDTTLAKPSHYLGILGMPGMTAWVGMVLIGKPKPGEQVFVSSAAGGVGLVVGQLAKIKGCRVVGSVGTDQKVKMVKEEFGFDDAFNYNSETDWDAALAKYFPKGIDIYFDNVGGKMLESVLNHINMNARIPISGMLSQYNEGDWRKRYGVRNLLNLVGKCAKMEGFLFDKHMHRMDEFVEEVGGYMKEGKIKYVEDVKEGIESFTDAFNSLFSGASRGKVLLRL